ncbi:MAG: hypothetical protein IPJ10_16265 [Flavobacteriales bacterium]|nr:hypothetical protein [Flavobacteriales bacterium]
MGELLVDLMLDERVEGGVRVLGIDYLDRVFGQNPEDFRCEILWPKGLRPRRVVGRTGNAG